MQESPNQLSATPGRRQESYIKRIDEAVQQRVKNAEENKTNPLLQGGNKTVDDQEWCEAEL